MNIKCQALEISTQSPEEPGKSRYGWDISLIGGYNLLYIEYLDSNDVNAGSGVLFAQDISPQHAIY